MKKIAWVVGASGGIGEATALSLAVSGWTVVLSGRREERLVEIAEQIQKQGGQSVTRPLDVASGWSILEAAESIEKQFGSCDLLVYCAGTNIQKRWWDDLDSESFDETVDTNLNAAVRSVLAVLPGMRRQKRGQIIIVSSWSGWKHLSVAGVAYGASKRALSAVVESINDQEGLNGIRATNLCPAEVFTPIVQTRPVPPKESERAAMLAPTHIATIIVDLASLPFEVCVNEMVVSSTSNRFYHQVSAHRGDADLQANL